MAPSFLTLAPESLRRQDTLQICPNPVFIIGSPRSGTSVLAWSLAEHSRLWTSKETDFLHELFGRAEAVGAMERAASRPETWLEHHAVSRAEFLFFLGSGINALVTNRSEGRRWIDQTPLYTLMTDTLAEMFPGAYFVHILRDGRNVVHSMIHFAERFGPALRDSGHLPEWASSMQAAARTWRSFVERADDFCGRHPDRAVTVRHEAICRDPEGQLGRLLEFLGEENEPRPAEFFRTSRINSSFQPLVWGGRGAAGDEARLARDDRLNDPWALWSAADRRTVEGEMGDLLSRLGYPSSAELRE